VRFQVTSCVNAAVCVNPATRSARQGWVSGPSGGAGDPSGQGQRQPATPRSRRCSDARTAPRAAREIAIEDGWEAVTIRRIADRLEYTSPIRYKHFSGKDGLLVELARDGFA
jgi:Bacterial regulatory proteins, tetR family